MHALDGVRNLYQMLSAEIEGLLEVNRDRCTTQMVQIQPSASVDILQRLPEIRIAEALIVEHIRSCYQSFRS